MKYLKCKVGFGMLIMKKSFSSKGDLGQIYINLSYTFFLSGTSMFFHTVSQILNGPSFISLSKCSTNGIQKNLTRTYGRHFAGILFNKTNI